MNYKQAKEVIDLAIQKIQTQEQRFSCYAMGAAMVEHRREAKAKGEGYAHVDIVSLYQWFTLNTHRLIQLHKVDDRSLLDRIAQVFRPRSEPKEPEWWGSNQPHIEARIAALRRFRDYLYVVLP